MADNIKYRFIQNVGDYFPAGYFGEDFLEKVQKQAGYNADQMKALCPPYVAFKARYYDYKNDIINLRMRRKDAITYTHMFHDDLLKVMGYDPRNPYQEFVTINEERNEVVPVRHILRHGAKTTMFIMEMQHLIKTGDEEPDGLFEQQYDDGKGQRDKQRYWAGQWSDVFEVPEGCKISPAVVNKAITSIFLLPEERRPHFILLLAGNTVFLFDQEKWNRGSYLMFSLDDLFSQASITTFRNYYALFHLLVCKETLAADSETVLMDALIEESYKSAYEVTKDLKNGVVTAVETLANEALYYMKYVAEKPFGKYDEATGEYDETNDDFEAEVKDDCLTIIYRLLFVFYAESRPELNILPTNDETYNKGYSLDMLRDLEQVRLVSEEARNGYFFDESLKKLFALLGKGYNENVSADDKSNRSFRVRHIDSPLFDDRRLKHLGQVRIRNVEWQKIICALSLSNKNGRCGRISYANLGVNQLGSVYESLLAYRGFYAEEDYIEVHKANDLKAGTYLDKYSRMDNYDPDEVLTDDNDAPIILKKGSFVYRLNGRDRQKSASYYTPEVLTRSTVKYTLKAILDEVAEGKRKATELLDLKILEPAMGAAAFQNEVINQLAEAYLQYQQQQLREAGKTSWRIEPDHYRDELQKVKAYIATHNVYGVDLNPTAIELGKLSLWLNVMHRDMETPFFSNRLAVGNAVVGAWLKVYDKKEVYGIPGKKGKTQKLDPNPWWEKAPHKVKFFSNKVNRSVNEVYHFLLPDANMLGVRGLKEQKDAHPEAYRKMTTILSDWKQAINYDDFTVLQRLSNKIDYLLKEYFQFQISIEKQTNNRKAVWGIPGDPEITIDSYAEKERLNDTRYRHDSAYFKLKMVMDYWCSLWFWEYDDAAALPTRKEYWADIEALLDVDNDKLEVRTRTALKAATDARGQMDMFEKTTQLDLFTQTPSMASEGPAEYVALTQEESEIVTLSKEELLSETQSHTTLFEDSFRFKIVKRYADRYHYFHPMLEFLEVFWLRDGFDIICGNPPFLKWLFEPQQVLSDYYPELLIRPDLYDADYVETHLNEYLTTEQVKYIYSSEQNEWCCCQALLNTPSLYGVLKGGQTDLFKCILVNSMSMLSPQGNMGLIHPDTVFTEAKGQPLREYLYPRLEARYHYSNKLKIFGEVHGEKIFDCCIYRGVASSISFDSISNLYHPSTVDACYAHSGDGICLGLEYVDENGEKHTNTAGHRDRIVHYDESLLKMVGNVFENTDEWQSCKLVSIHAMSSLNILRRFLNFQHVSTAVPFITVAFDSVNAVKNGTIRQETKFPEYDAYQMIFNSTQVGILSPFSKLPRTVCARDAHYDMVDYTQLPIDYDIRTNYVPKTDILSFKSCIDETGQWFERYKVGFKKMMDPTHERTLKGGILPPKASHTHSIISLSFEKEEDLIQFVGLGATVLYDFFIKTVGVRNLMPSIASGLPFGVDGKYSNAIKVRVLRMNCVNHWYKDLWENNYDEMFKKEKWSKNDNRLSDFSSLGKAFDKSVLLRNEYERRQALVELDVLAAMALGFTLEDLLFVYVNTFPTTQKYEADTWYDANGRVVFSVSGEYDLKIPRTGNRRQGVLGWEDIRGEQIDDNTYRGTAPTHIHTIDPAKSELYGGQQITFVAPFTRCNRIEDYRKAWEHFEKIFNN